MRTALDRVDVVDVAIYVLVVGRVVGHRHLDRDALLLRDDVDDVLDEVLLGAVDIASEFLEPSLGVVFLGERCARLVQYALVDERQADTSVEEGELAQTVGEDLELILRDGEDGLVGLEDDRRTRTIGSALGAELGRGHAATEVHGVDLTPAVDDGLQRGGEGIDAGDPYAV